jgi:pyruvate/2-oxoglutarate dehydrogenase complex dihydrolipoamide acyltransferase (E2) component|tara:strand:- start:1321 stop:1554 length:234 start_codon:yes stop_codon:yes gene_type:complete
MVDIIVPNEVLENDDCVVQEWWFDDGEIVEEGIVIVDIMVAKVSIEVPAPASGRLTILLQAEEEIGESGLIGKIEPL